MRKLLPPPVLNKPSHVPFILHEFRTCHWEPAHKHKMDSVVLSASSMGDQEFHLRVFARDVERCCHLDELATHCEEPLPLACEMLIENLIFQMLPASQLAINQVEMIQVMIGKEGMVVRLSMVNYQYTWVQKLGLLMCHPEGTDRWLEPDLICNALALASRNASSHKQSKTSLIYNGPKTFNVILRESVDA
jgi:hypothetical protein